jgi:hypothetical protein
MPVNFSRPNIEDVQRGSKYFLSEKTDGVRHFMIFTGDTVVLVDRAMRGKQPIPLNKGAGGEEPMASIIPLIKPVSSSYNSNESNQATKKRRKHDVVQYYYEQRF